MALAAALPAASADTLHAAYKDVAWGLTDEVLSEAPALLLSFVTGECGSERWGDTDGAAFAAAQLPRLEAAGRRYMVATGGALGIFTCATDTAMDQFVARYDSRLLIGLDFDIEGAQTAAQIDSLAARMARLQQQRPALRLMFTLATFAASDGSGRSLNATGLQVLDAMRRHGLDAIINLMVMNYGAASPAVCVPQALPGRGCDMGASALQAVQNLHRVHRVPYDRIAVTPMLGENDVAQNVFTPADAMLLARAAAHLGLAGVHHWSLDRDQPCPPGEPRVSPRCHALTGVPQGIFGLLLGERTR